MKAKTVMVVAALSTAAYGSYPQEGMYSDAVTNIWTGAAGDNDWNTASNWSLGAVPVNGTDKYVHVEGYEDISGQSGIRGVYAKFNSTADLTVTTTGSSPYATRGVIDRKSMPDLTKREKEALDLMCAGHSNEDIARLMGITHSSAKQHLKHIFEKMGVSSRVEAMSEAIRRGFVSAPANRG